uniref:Lipocalin n=1 Tax=Amblyomma americanum TaxID=6943 RepID=A0A0C9S526_AMBAM
MVRRICLFLCIAIFRSSADTSGTCPGPNVMDGWSFLRNNSQVDMVKRNFNMTANITCMSSNTTSKIDATHTVHQFVRYRNLTSNSWVNGTQTLIAYADEGGKYNFMNTTQTLGPVNTSYTFLYTAENCTVVKVKYLFNETSDTSSASTEGALSWCALWVRDTDFNNPHNCCEEFFQKNCTKPVYEVYNATQCKAF